MTTPDANIQLDLKPSELLEFHIQEYVALRSEQRTRLDSASKIIQYYAAILAGAIAGLLAVYAKAEDWQFKFVLSYVLLFVPVLTMPFALAQQCEEIIVRRIGDYFGDHLQSKISHAGDPRYWCWETYHYQSSPWLLKITAAFRSGLLTVFAVSSFSGALYVNGREILASRTKIALTILDLTFIVVGIWIAYQVSKKRYSIKSSQPQPTQADAHHE